MLLIFFNTIKVWKVEKWYKVKEMNFYGIYIQYWMTIQALKKVFGILQNPHLIDAINKN